MVGLRADGLGSCGRGQQRVGWAPFAILLLVHLCGTRAVVVLQQYWSCNTIDGWLVGRGVVQLALSQLQQLAQPERTEAAPLFVRPKNEQSAACKVSTAA